MAKIRVFVGLDYHRVSVQVCVMNSRGEVLGNRRCENDWKAIRRFAESFGRVAGAALESCSGAAELAEELVERAGWSVDLAHPGYVNRMRQNPDKTDHSDAELLADLRRVGYLPRVWLAPRAVRELRLLVRDRQQLTRQIRAIKLRVGALLREQRIATPPGRRWTVRWINWLRAEKSLSEQGRWVTDRNLHRLEHFVEERKLVEARLSEVTQDDPLVARMLEFAGIGQVTAWTLRAEVGRFDRFASGKQLARFCGLSPRNASSGERQADAGLIRAANGMLRATLIEAAHRLARHETRWNRFAVSMRLRGKPGSVVAAAVANRWIRWLYHHLQPTVPQAA